ncbi:MAG: AmmeMemoRadiSam system radical SAM enzyme [Planctomycetaceae bacterium]|jgi:pyruvate formate lyase activating enzyme|nr:AmmeMemoRadiSam system radical SAM enzyme [Planctomycetaceae bacterium]
MLTCDICPRECLIAEGKTGFCGTRTCRNGQIVPLYYGQCTGLAVDPIEKKPLYHFYPGSKVLSLGTIGCNFACRFCQNWTTAQSCDATLLRQRATPEEIARFATGSTALKSVAFTYNEPITWAEYAVDAAECCRKNGIKTVAVSNGYIGGKQRERFFNAMDAANIDLKSFSEHFYRKQCGASIEPVLKTLKYLAKKPDFHLEMTTLLIPSLNDSPQEIGALTQWIAEELGCEIPLHFSAYFPAGKEPPVPVCTPPQTLFRAREAARNAGLKYVYTGNIRDAAGQTTYCPQCRQAVIERDGYRILEMQIDEDGCCKFCGQTIAGQFSY